MPVDQSRAALSEQKLREACLDLERRLRAGDDCAAEDFRTPYPEVWDEPEAALELIFTEFTLRKQRGEQPNRDAWYQRFPQWRQRLERMFQVHDLLGAESNLSVTAGDTPWASNDGTLATAGVSAADKTHGRRVGGYELLEEIARGGMGVVYKARQVDLNRIVALKVILSGEYAGEEQRARFRREAEAAARLHHPNIVQIHEIGEQDGLPFLSLEYVDGKSLEQILTERRAGGSLGFSSAESARLVETLARAMNYAHQQGVIHRDLKPANILLSKSSTDFTDNTDLKTTPGSHPESVESVKSVDQNVPKIADFGLAKTLNDNRDHTRTGQLLGTPSYMAPEQAAGRNADIGPATDVFALGVILYELLTGRLPFQGTTVAETLEQVRTVEPIPPGQLQPSLPRDLQTICLKCLRKEPTLRYGAAESLAEDLRRFLHHEPILARPVGQFERGWRWCRRNPALAALTAGVALLLVAGTMGATSLAVWALNEKGRADSNASKADANAQEERAARALAEHRFAQAEGAVAQYLDGIERHARLKEADFVELRRKLLAAAIPFYEDFVRQKPGDVTLEDRRGRAYHRLALIHEQLGDRQRAVADYQQMCDIFQKLAAEFPARWPYRQELAGGHNNLGVLLRTFGKHGQAREEFRQAIALQQELAAELPDFGGVRKELAGSHDNLGGLLGDLGKWEQAVSERRLAVELRKSLVAQFPAKHEYHCDQASSHNGLGAVLHRIGKVEEAEQEYRQAILILESVAGDARQDPSWRHALGISRYNRAALLRDEGKQSAAATEHQRALELQRALVAEFRALPGYRRDLALTHHSLGHLFKQSAKPAEALAEYERAMVLRKQLAEQFSDVPEFQEHLASSHNALGIIHAEKSRWAEAKAEFEKGVNLLEPVARKWPEAPDFRAELAVSHQNLGRVFRAAKQPDQALAGQRRALDLRKQLVAEHPNDLSYQQSLAQSHNSMGLLLRDLDKADEAAAEHRHAIVLLERLVGQFPAAIAHRSTLGSTLNNLALLLRNQDKLDEARRLVEQAIEHQSVAHRAAPKNPNYSLFLRNHYWGLAETLCRQQDHAAAAEAVHRLAQVRPENSADVYIAAQLLARCATLAGSDETLAGPERQKRAAVYADRSVEYLQTALDRGFRDTARLKADTAFVILHPRADFQKLIEKLKKQK